MEKKLCKREINIKMEAIKASRRYCKAGKQGNSPKTAKDAKSILRFVLPILAPDDNFSSYNTGAKAIKRLQTAEHCGRLRWRNTSKMMMKTQRVKFKTKY